MPRRSICYLYKLQSLPCMLRLPPMSSRCIHVCSLCLPRHTDTAPSSATPRNASPRPPIHHRPSEMTRMIKVTSCRCLGRALRCFWCLHKSMGLWSRDWLGWLCSRISLSSHSSRHAVHLSCLASSTPYASTRRDRWSRHQQAAWCRIDRYLPPDSIVAYPSHEVQTMLAAICRMSGTPEDLQPHQAEAEILQVQLLLLRPSISL